MVVVDREVIPPSGYLEERKKIAALLSEVPDPEIPGVSIVDLGMVLNIAWENENWLIELAPTYSGCPAIDVIPIMVETRLREAGYSNFKVRMVISPPWATDWISPQGQQKLFDLGIAPPNPEDVKHLAEGRPKKCPQCGSLQMELISRFSSTPCKAAYRCMICQEPFEYFKCY